MKKIVCFIGSVLAAASAIAGETSLDATQPAMQGTVLSTSAFAIAGKTYSLPVLRRPDGVVCQTYVAGIKDVGGTLTPTLAQLCNKATKFRIRLDSPNLHESVTADTLGIGQKGTVSVGNEFHGFAVTVSLAEVKSDGTVHAIADYDYSDGQAKEKGTKEFDLQPDTPQGLFTASDVKATITLEK